MPFKAGMFIAAIMALDGKLHTSWHTKAWYHFLLYKQDSSDWSMCHIKQNSNLVCAFESQTDRIGWESCKILVIFVHVLQFCVICEQTINRKHQTCFRGCINDCLLNRYIQCRMHREEDRVDCMTLRLPHQNLFECNLKYLHDAKISIKKKILSYIPLIVTIDLTRTQSQTLCGPPYLKHHPTPPNTTRIPVYLFTLTPHQSRCRPWLR